MVDEAVADFMTWVEAKAREQQPGTAPAPLKKGQAMVPTYPTIAAILAEYGAAEPDTLPDIDPAEIAALVNELGATVAPAF